MKKILLLLSCLCIVLTLTAQQNSGDCGVGGRYLNKIFTPAAATTVIYGHNVTISGAQKDLKMDIYQPAGDARTDRPVLVIAFGGSFIGGARTDATMVNICKAWAARGYVTASIDYRLYDGALFPIPDSTKFANVVVKAVADFKAAVRFLRMTAATGNPYGIDPSKIIVGGESAGSIVAMHTTYLRTLSEAPAFIQQYVISNGGIHGNTDLPGNSTMAYSDSTMGMVNYYGGLYRKELLNAGEPPIISIHGTADNVVPYNYGYATVFGQNIITLNGSGRCNPRATAVGVTNQLISVPNGGHGGFSAAFTDSMETSAVLFMYNNVVCPLAVATQNARPLTTFSLQPNPATAAFTVRIADMPSAYTLELYDAFGRTVRSLHSHSPELTVAREALPTGAYFVRIRFDDAAQRLPITQKVVFE